LFHLLTLAARILALGDYTAKQALAQDDAELAGIYPGNPKRSTCAGYLTRPCGFYVQTSE
jgi:hypothetical protein